MGNQTSKDSNGDGGEAAARYRAMSESEVTRKREPPEPIHVEVFGTPLSGRRTLLRAISTGESFTFEEQTEETQKVLRRKVQYTAAQALLLATQQLTEAHPERDSLQKIVDDGIDALLRDDKQYESLLKCAMDFDANEDLRTEVKSLINPVCGTSFDGFSDIRKVFKPDFVPSRKQLLSIHLPDSCFKKSEKVITSYNYHPVQVVAHPTKDMLSVPKPPSYPYYVIFTVSLLNLLNDEEISDIDSGKKKKKINPILLAIEQMCFFVQSEFVKKASCFYVALSCTEQFNLKFMMNKGDKIMKKVFPKYDDGKKAPNAIRYIADEFMYELKQLSIPASVFTVNMLDVANLNANVLKPLFKPVIDAANVYVQEDQERMHAEVAAALMSSAHKKSAIVVPVSTVKNRFEIRSGFVSLLGPRKTNEDAEVCCDDYKHPDLKFTSKVALYAIFDGHGGKDISAGCSKIVPRILMSQPTFPMDPVTAFTNGFAEADKELTSIKQKSGSTCVLVTILGNTLLVGNLGDSECVLASLVDGKVRFTLLTHKHSVTDPDERQRIEKIEPVIVCGRIQGTLAVARSFGDFDYKSDGKLFVSVVPHVAAHALHPNDQFLILGCDGLWDTVTYRDAVITAHKLRGQGKRPEEVAQALADLALERGSSDNVTVIVVFFTWEKLSGIPGVSTASATTISEGVDSDACSSDVDSCPAAPQLEEEKSDEEEEEESSEPVVDKAAHEGSHHHHHHQHQHHKHSHHSHSSESADHKSHSHKHGHKQTKETPEKTSSSSSHAKDKTKPPSTEH